MLALPGPLYSYRYDGDFTISGLPIMIHQEGGRGRGTAWACWDAAAAAAMYLEAAAAAHEPALHGLASVVELGSGTGLAGLAAAAALRLPTTLTDLPEALPALRRNIAANPSLAHLATAAPLDWTAAAQDLAALGLDSRGGGSSSSSEGHSTTTTTTSRPGRLVLAADCVWLEELMGPFVAALELAASGPHDRALLAYQSRADRVDRALFGRLERCLEVRPAAALPGEPPRGHIDLYWLAPKAAGPQAAAGVS